jgi:hypothetical protein
MPSSLPRSTVLIIAVLVLAAPTMAIIRSLTLQERDGVLSRLEGDEKLVRATQAAPPDRVVQAGSALILRQSTSSAADDSILSGAQVSVGTVDLALVIRGLPAGLTISPGRPQGAGEWRIPAPDVANASIHPPPGFSAAIDLAVEQRLSDDSVVDRGSAQRERPTVSVTMMESARAVAALDVAPKPTVTTQAIYRGQVPRSVAAKAGPKHKLTAAVSANPKRPIRSTAVIRSDPNGVYLAGERIGVDPDPNIRAQLMRDDAGRQVRMDNAGRQLLTQSARPTTGGGVIRLAKINPE